METRSVSVRQEFCRDLGKAVAVLSDHGADDVHVFGSIIEPFGDEQRRAHRHHPRRFRPVGVLVLACLRGTTG